MNRLYTLLQNKKNILSVYFTAGFPNINDTGTIITTLSAKGVDMIEVGIPFSDPMADGVVIQESSTIALKNGITLKKILDQVEDVRDQVPDTPLVAMGYLNCIMQFGAEEFFKRCKQVGIDAIIIPDLPFADYQTDYRPLCDKYDIPLIMLITPETSIDRIHFIDDNCSGFIYMVSSASTTGTKDRFNEEQLAYFERINNLELKHKRLIGFGISNKATMDAASSHSSGGIIGSLFIKCLRRNPTIAEAVDDLLATLKK